MVIQSGSCFPEAAWQFFRNQFTAGLVLRIKMGVILVAMGEWISFLHLFSKQVDTMPKF